MSVRTNVEEIEALLKNLENTIAVIRSALDRIRWDRK